MTCAGLVGLEVSVTLAVEPFNAIARSLTTFMLLVLVSLLQFAGTLRLESVMVLR